MALRSTSTEARLAMRISSSMVSMSAPEPVGRYVMISPWGRAFAFRSSSALSMVASEKRTRMR